MTIDALCRVCHIVGVTVNADCGHEVHRACCHETDDKPLGLIVCRFCWHEPSVAIPRRRRESAEAAA